MTKSHGMSIPEYFAGQSVLVTGGTGLMGKVLIEKILRSCRDVEMIYLLTRPKKNVPIEERWSKLTDLPLFEKLKSENPDALKKVHLIRGDMTAENLGMSPDDIQLLKEKVTLVYHVAALIQFTDSMKDSLVENVKGTYLLLQLARSFINLKVFIHMSSAYSNFNKHPDETFEQMIPPCQDWKVMLKMAENNSFEFESLKEKLLDGHPNPYTWSKSLAENVVNEYRTHFRTIIMRPGIVCATMDEPLEGWVDASNGYSALALAAGYGLLRVVPIRGDYYVDFIPVDVAIKASLIAPWKQEITRYNEGKSETTTDVYNCAYMKIMPATNHEITKWGLENFEKYPSEKTVWIPNPISTNNDFLVRILFWFLQVLPAAIVDLGLKAMGKPTKAIRMTKRLMNSIRLTKKIRHVSITFPNERFLSLTMFLKNEDKDAFSYKTKFDNVATKAFVIDQINGFRKYFMKEDFSEEAMEKNRKRMKKMKFMHLTITSLLYMAAVWLVASHITG